MSATMYVPGRGVVALGYRAVDAAVSEYDERLFAADHPHTGTPSIFIKMPPDTEWQQGDGLAIDGNRCVPVMAFPHGFPHTDEVLRRLHEADAVRRGHELLDHMNRANAALNEPARREAAERAGVVAEVTESAMHRIGKTSYYRSLAKLDPKQRVSTVNKRKNKHGRG